MHFISFPRKIRISAKEHVGGIKEPFVFFRPLNACVATTAKQTNKKYAAGRKREDRGREGEIRRRKKRDRWRPLSSYGGQCFIPLPWWSSVRTNTNFAYAPLRKTITAAKYRLIVGH